MGQLEATPNPTLSRRSSCHRRRCRIHGAFPTQLPPWLLPQLHRSLPPAPYLLPSKFCLVQLWRTHRPTPNDKTLCYLSGVTRIVVIDRHASLTNLSVRLSLTAAPSPSTSSPMRTSTPLPPSLPTRTWRTRSRGTIAPPAPALAPAPTLASCHSSAHFCSRSSPTRQLPRRLGVSSTT